MASLPERDRLCALGRVRFDDVNRIALLLAISVMILLNTDRPRRQAIKERFE
jgi:hypothetical protein